MYKYSGALTDRDPYVVRQADEDLYRSVKNGEFCYVFNSRKMGKTSLVVRSIKRLSESGYVCVFVDLNGLGSVDNEVKWYESFIKELGYSLNLYLDESIDQWCSKNKKVSKIELFSTFVNEKIIGSLDRRVVIFIDEIDVFLQQKFKPDDFFGYIRYCHEQRAIRDEYKKITFVLVGTVTPNQLIEDKRRTPFNIGTPIKLIGIRKDDDLTPLLDNLRDKTKDPERLFSHVLLWTNGQPFLTQKICALISEAKGKISDSDQKDFVREIIYKKIIGDWKADDNPAFLSVIEDRILASIHTKKIVKIYAEIIKNKKIIYDGSPEHSDLILSGISIINDNNYLIVANKICSIIFDEKWAREVLVSGRPYQDKMDAWINSNRKITYLLRGRELR